MAKNQNMNLKIYTRETEKSQQTRGMRTTNGVEITLNGEKLTRCFNFELTFAANDIIKAKVERYATDDIDRVLLTDESELSTETRTFALMTPISLDLDVKELVSDGLG